MEYSFALPTRASLRGTARIPEASAVSDGSLRLWLLDQAGGRHLLRDASLRERAGSDPLELEADLGKWSGEMVTLRLEVAGASSLADVPTLGWSDLRIDGSAAPASEPPRVARKRYNLLLVLFDTLRADRIEPYGASDVDTPSLARLARRGVTFANTTSNASWTTPSVASLFTSVYPWAHGIRGVDQIFRGEARLHSQIPYLPDLLASNGYSTLAVLNNPMVSPVFGFGRGFSKVVGNFSQQAAAKTRRYLDPRAQADAVWAESVAVTLRERGERPFFVFLHEIDPHHPYDPPPPYDSLYDPDYEGEMKGFEHLLKIQDSKEQRDPDAFRRLQGVKKSEIWEALRPGDRRFIEGAIRASDFPLDERDVRHLNALYDGEVTFMDAYLGRILEHLEEAGLREETLVVFTSDHGEMLGEHTGFGHGSYLFEEVLRVPLIFSLPGVLPEGHRPLAHAELVDLSPTVLDLFGIERPGSMQGRSLVPFLFGSEDRDPDREAFSDASIGSDRSRETVRFRGWKLVREVEHRAGRADRDRFELFDLGRDPEERVDRREEAPVIASTLEQMLAWRRYRDAVARHRRPAPPVQEIDSELLEQMRALGYVQ